MRRTLNVVDRIVVAITGLVLIFAGAVALLWWQGVDTVVDDVSRIDNVQIHDAPQQTWWPWALLGATIVLAVIGLWLFLANVRPNRVRMVLSGTGGDRVGGARAVSAIDVGRAAAMSLERDRQVQSTSTRAYTDGRTPILELTVTADPAADGGDLIEMLEVVRHHLQRSVAGSDVRVRVLLHRGANH